MKKLMNFVALGAVLAASSSMALADSITVSGPDTFNSTGIQFPGGVGLVSSAQDGDATIGYGGEYLSFLGQRATLTSFNYATAAGVTVFSTMNPAGTTLSFMINSLNTPQFGTDAFNQPTLALTGIGTFLESGFANQMGTFSLTSSAAGPNSVDFSYQLIGSPTSVTPEPNSLVLLGTGLIGAAGMLFMRRRNAAAGIF